MSDAPKATQSAADNPWIFLGFDLRQIPALWVSGWKEALSWPFLRWLNVAPPVHVYFADGRKACYENGRLSADDSCGSSHKQAGFQALVLPDDILLHRTMTLPDMSTADREQTLRFEVESITPFRVDQTVWGYRADDQQSGAQQIDLVLASRTHINQLMQRLALPVQETELELWGLSANEQPIILTGFAELRRKRYVQKRILQTVVLLLLIPVLLLAIASVPMIHAQLRLSQAERVMAGLESRSGVAEAQRGKLLAQSQSAQVVLSYLKTLPQPLSVLNLLSATIPDTAFLERLDMDAQRVRITGQADNAAALTQTLGALPQLQNVHAPSAITRNPQNNKERFTLEFSVNPGATHEK